MNRYSLGLAARSFMILMVAVCVSFNTAENNEYDLQLDVVSSGFDGESCWFHPRSAAIPGKVPVVVMTMQKWMVKRSDVFFPLWSIHTTDNGRSWSAPQEHAKALGRYPEANGVEVGVSDVTPKWHARSGKILGIGSTVRYKDNHLVQGAPRQTVYTYYNPATNSWSGRKSLEMPKLPEFYNEGSGSTQRVDLPDGNMLIPTYHKPQNSDLYSVSILKCWFDGEKITLIDQGKPLTFPTGRGFVEPSLTVFKGLYYLTLRNNDAAYIATSLDGLNFTTPVAWKFDDGAELGSYNTQSHWVTHSGGIYLVYTRKNANNDNVVRHRAPLFIAKVDPKKLVVIRASEKILVPNTGAQLGNFGVMNLNENETWVTTSEGMSQGTQYGADGRVYIARIKWRKPNKTWDKY